MNNNGKRNLDEIIDISKPVDEPINYTNSNKSPISVKIPNTTKSEQIKKKQKKSSGETNETDGMIFFNREISDIDDLIYLGSQYRPGKKYNINVEKLYKLIPVLTKLKKVIGMDTVKKTIVNQIIYFIQDFQETNSDMLHTVIQGPPGVGKTMLGEIIGEIYYRLNIIETPTNTNPNTTKSSKDCCSDDEEKDKSQLDQNSDFKFIIAKRSDLIGKYLGHTAAKTQEVINKSLGGVLFIDEAYSLGNPEGRDSYSKECIDTLNQNLTEKKNQLLVIIAGYKDALDSCFFSYNEGLRRRFPFVYTIDKYTPQEMSHILRKMILNLGTDWDVDIEQKILDQYFEKNLKLFPNSAGDIETLIFSIKIEHSKRVFCQPPGSILRKKITKTDIDNALNTYKINKEKKDKKEEIPPWLQHLYV
jgi:SpoVK/Ycf46/Vps4 family AAA+-type ATPase